MGWQAALEAARELSRRRGGGVDARVWIPGCGEGLTVYELTAAIGEVMGQDALRARVQVIGTSTSETALRAARAGRFAAEDLAHLPDLIVVRYFPEQEDGSHAFVEDLRVSVSFARNAPGRDRPVRRVDLLDARPLVTGDDDVSITELAEAFGEALRPGGVLYLPAAEVESVRSSHLLAIDDHPGVFERPLPDDATVLGAAWRPRRPFRIVVVNEHQLFVRSLAVLLESLFGRFLTVVGVSDDPDHALALIDRHDPDLVVIDVTGPGSADLPDRLAESRPDMHVLALVDDPHDAWREVTTGGVGGVLPRSASADELIGPLLAVAEGWAVLPPEALHVLAHDLPVERYQLLDRLDDDQMQLWAWIAEGKQDNEIAEELYVSARTVKRRVGALLRELDVSRRVEAAELAGRLGVRARVQRDAAQLHAGAGAHPR